MGDGDNRTEKPTPRRLEQARKEGNYISTKEMVSGAQFIVFAMLLLSGFQEFLSDSAGYTKSFLKLAFSGTELQREGLVFLFRNRLAPAMGGMLLSGLFLTTAAFVAQMAASKLGISGKKIAPDLQRLNPLSRLKELPSQNLSQFLRSALLLPIFLGVAAWLVWSQGQQFLYLPLLPWTQGVLVVGQSIRELIERALYVFLLLGLFDWFRQSQKYMKKMRMSKQEIRDEHKEVEGNPQIKAKVRRMQRDMSRRRMMADVPKASAVIVNPTHYAVAIRYDLAAGAAPKVVAKGRNHVARRIRELAISSEVPIIENPPLARALFAAADIGQEIPPHLYKAVAEILAYLYRIMGGRLPGQSFA
ncbi:MAG TPA: EscU/YscU/HrcU family type III secretion system export apparatus switch protein [Bryobacteraceae bacterium]|nr:EscU/YscU/HrcU family type III secretion system export apparatus switch protein [Bryobacteraceae bacterium]